MGLARVLLVRRVGGELDLADLIIEYPLLSLLVVVPIVGFAALVKIGIVLATGAKGPKDVEGSDP